MNSTIYIHNYQNRVLFILLFVCTFLLLNTNNLIDTFSEYWYFTILGLFGAIIANSTGAGGGIVFVPFFSSLGMAATEIIGTSIVIQCFGMTAGTISWLTSSKLVSYGSTHLFKLISKLMIISGFFSILGILTAQYVLIVSDSESLVIIFRLLSVFFGVTIIMMLLKKNKISQTNYIVNNIDYVFISSIAFVGGLVTAWISIGIGEIVATYLIIRKYPAMAAISLGVTLSSISVLTASYQHIAILNSVNWEVVSFAAPAAIIGGTYAYLLSEKLGSNRLKLFFAMWILVTGIAM